MKIGIMGAMEQEITMLQSQMEQSNAWNYAHLTFIEGKLAGCDIILVKCGIGKVAAAVATTVLIDRFAPDYVVNTGSAGGFDPELEIGDIVIASGVQHHDVDVTHFGYERGQVFGMPSIYGTCPKMHAAAMAAAEKLEGVNYKEGLVCTGDSFIGCDDAAGRLRDQFPNMYAVEMEGAAIGQTCHMLDTPFLVIRSLSDIAGKTSTMSFKQYLDIAGRNSAHLVKGMVEQMAG